MPRTARLTVAQYPHLVVARSVSGAFLFYRETDYEDYIQHLRQLVRDKMVEVFAFCLEREEIRLLVRPKRLDLARIMQRLHTRHSLRINARLHRRGALFAGRFKSHVFAPESLAAAARSIHLWPLRVGLTRRVESYRFSSMAAYTLTGDYRLDFIETAPVLQQFSNTLPLAQRAFAKYVESASLEKDDYGVEPIDLQVSEQDLGPRPKRRHSLKGLAKKVALLVNVKVSHLLGPSRRQDLVMGRRLLAAYAVLSAHRTVTEVALFMKRDKAQVSRLVSQGMDLMENHVPFRVLYDSVEGSRARPNHE